MDRGLKIHTLTSREGDEEYRLRYLQIMETILQKFIRFVERIRFFSMESLFMILIEMRLLELIL